MEVNDESRKVMNNEALRQKKKQVVVWLYTGYDFFSNLIKVPNNFPLVIQTCYGVQAHIHHMTS